MRRTARYNQRTASSEPLTPYQLAGVAPGIFASTPHPDRSQHYKVINTAEVLKAMATEGFYPIYATQSRRSIENAPFAKHMVVLRHQDSQAYGKVGDTAHEIVLTNAADGSAAYHLHYGLFRLACANGMVVSDNTIANVRVAHKGRDITERVVEGSHEIIRNGDVVQAKIEQFKSRILDHEEKFRYAWQAAKLRFPNEPDEFIDEIAPSMIRVRRPEDISNSLWTVYQRAQEKAIRGGLHLPERRQATREITQIDRVIDLNKQLWKLTEDYA